MAVRPVYYGRMTVATLNPAANATVRSRRGTAALLLLAGAIALVFFAAAALPYLLSTSHNAATFAGRRGWLLLHIAGGSVALFAGPLQIWLGVSERRMDLHRRLGIAYMAAIVVGAIGAYYLAFHHPSFGPVFGAGLASLATAWLVTIGLAFAAIRRHLVEQHKEWMIRSYVLTFGFVLFRIALPAMIVAGMNPQAAGAIAAWGCWAVPLVAAEAIMQGRKIAAVRH